MSGVGSTNAMKKGSANNPFLAFSEADMAGYLNSAYTGCIVKYSGEAIKRQISDINKTVGEYAQNLVFDTTKLGLGAIVLPAAIKIDITKNGSSTTQYIYEGWVKDGKVYPSAVTGSINTLVLASSLNSGADVIAVINNGTWQREAVNDQGKITLWAYSEDVLFTVIPDANGSLAPFERFVSIVPYIVGELYKVVYGDGVYYYEEFYYISEERTTGNSDYIAPGKTMYDFTGSLQTGNGSKINPYIANTVDEMNGYLTTAYRGAFVKYVGTSTADYTKDAVYQVADDGDTTRYAILPALENEGKASDLAAGKQLINSQGEVVEGTAGGEIDYTQDVMFWDYDGTLIYSCTLEEAKALTELPEAPNHSDKGLVFDSWNYTLEDIQKINHGADIGALYVTSDKKTHLFFNIDSDLVKTVKLHVTRSYTNYDAIIKIDWGDGTSIETYTINAQSYRPEHAYVNKGKYEVTIENISDYRYQVVSLGDSSYSVGDALNLFGLYVRYGAINIISTILTKVYLGEKIRINCGSCTNLTEISLYTSKLGAYGLQYTKVKHVNTKSAIEFGTFNYSAIETFSCSANYIEPSAFKYCAIKRIACKATQETYSDNVSLDIPQLLTCIWPRSNPSHKVTYYILSCKYIALGVIPQDGNTSSDLSPTLRTYGAIKLYVDALSPYGSSTVVSERIIYAPKLDTFVLNNKTPVPLTAAFSNIPSTCKYYVPDESVDTYKTTDGWKDMADRIYPLSQLT